MTGKIGRAPCGHQGVAIIGQFYRCIEGCKDDSPPEELGFEIVEEKTKEMCPNPDCRSTDIEPFAFAFHIGIHCNVCGRIWT